MIFLPWFLRPLFESGLKLRAANNGASTVCSFSNELFNPANPSLPALISGVLWRTYSLRTGALLGKKWLPARNLSSSFMFFKFSGVNLGSDLEPFWGNLNCIYNFIQFHWNGLSFEHWNLKLQFWRDFIKYIYSLNKCQSLSRDDFETTNL